jgi:hypothetical protein
MRSVVYAAAVLALAMVFSADALRSALVSSASALFEATPFLLAGVAMSRLLRGARFVEYLGCGCGNGPSARSIPAAAATWLIFGPFVALARYAGALFVDRALHAAARRTAVNVPPVLLDELGAVLPAALLAGAATQVMAAFDPARLSPPADALLGALLGFVAAPCGLGAVTLAGALRIRAPFAATAFLCIAGIVDLRALRSAPHAVRGHDAFAYASLAGALAIVVWRHGDALVHPAFSLPLACCAGAAAWAAGAHRRERCSAARIAPALMLVGALLGAPPPQYRATETTLADIFAGERLRFTGALARDAKRAAIVRYAITCCRADAAPVAVRLERSPPYPSGTWLRIDGTIENVNGALELAATAIKRVAAPSDPFIYL